MPGLFLEVVVFGGAALAFGLWQWWSINQEIKRDRAKKAQAERERGS